MVLLFLRLVVSPTREVEGKEKERALEEERGESRPELDLPESSPRDGKDSVSKCPLLPTSAQPDDPPTLLCLTLTSLEAEK